MLKINLGCGTNKLQGWANHDADVDITERLPWRDGAVDYVFAEHVVEHVTYPEALAFFGECVRVLRQGGIARIAVPSVERVWRLATPEYGRFISKWVPDDGTDYTRRAMTNILFMHGHQAPWTEGLLLASLYYAGFRDVSALIPGYSLHDELRNLEGHGKVIGNEFNSIETVVVEAIK